MLQLLQRGIEALRQPDRNPRCYEMTEQDRSDCIRGWNNRNVWNTPELSNEDKLNVRKGV
jgi:hypothetical protein